METTITGKTLLARLSFLEGRLGSDGTKRVIGKLSPEDQKVIGGMILPISRYPLVLIARLDAAIGEAIDPANPKRVFRTLGRSSAELNFDRFHPTLIAPDDPHGLARELRRLRDNPAEATRLGANGRRAAEAKHARVVATAEWAAVVRRMTEQQ